jgi:multisubunit Na+/H+ antiporter MnhC subunit
MLNLNGKNLIGGPAFVGFVVILTLAGSAWAVLTVYELLALDLYPVREEQAVFSPYFLTRSLFALVASIALIGALHRLAPPASPLETHKVDPLAQTIAIWSMVLGFGFAIVLLANPYLVMEITQEDTVIEWASALFLLIGSGCFVAEAVRRMQNRPSRDWMARLELLISAGIAALLFLIAMEEISWAQRLLSFETPHEIEQMNWQGEFNLHNLQTDLSETVYYTGACLFLIVLPLVRETALRGPAWFDRLLAFAPSRSVAAVSAPATMIYYGHWNLIPIQVTTFCAFLVMLAYAAAAKNRYDRNEFSLFLFLACGMVFTQGIFLAFGNRMLEVGNASEFTELFITVGLGWYAVDRFRSRLGSLDTPLAKSAT